MLEKTPQKYFANVPAALKALSELEQQGRKTKTYEELSQLLGVAKAIKLMYGEVTQLKQEAEWTILSLRREIGVRIDENVPKLGGPGRGKRFNPGVKSLRRSDLPINGKSRAWLMKLAKLSRDKMRKIVEDLWATQHDATLKAVIEETKFGNFKVQRAEREKNLAKKIKAMPDKTYGVVLADPEWHFKTHSDKGQRKSAANHYPVSDTQTIMSRKIPAAKDCVLFLWAIVPMLPEALNVMGAWGFKYVSHFAWDKEITGTGYWNLNQHEILLIGTRGKVVPPAPGTQFPSLIREKRTKHSAKPEQSYRIIESYYPNVPKIELNRRGPARKGWDAWGNEAE